MKQKRLAATALCALGLSLFVMNTGCRKAVLRDLKYMTKPAHCYNQQLDADENITDAGGSCGCRENTPVSYCSLAANQVKVGSSTYTVSSFEKDTLGNGNWRFTLKFNSTEYLVVTCTPAVYLNYELSNNAMNPSDPDDINVQVYTSTYGLQDLGYGKFEIATDGCVAFLRSCDTGFNYGFSGVINCKLFVDLKLFM
ncbi:MAG: hypothetical protein JNL57_09120 [Bacteroidetes bacterium]|nr:hypothetical protein [Bacteroidota bacterium]